VRGSLIGNGPNQVYMPAPNFNGIDSFTFKVSNGSTESAVAMVFIAVSPVNDAPVLNLPAALEVNAGETLNLVVSAFDVDGERQLQFVATGLPSGATFVATSGTSRQLSWTPTFAQTGVNKIDITVMDNGSPKLSNSRTLIITVEAKWGRTSGPGGARINTLFV